MPTATTNHTIRVNSSPELNTTASHRLLSRIMSFYNAPLNSRNQKSYTLLCKALFCSYDFQTRVLSERRLRQFFNKNGFPISFSEDTLYMKHSLWDSIERFSVICQGPDLALKIVSFHRHKGQRTVRYGLRG